MTFFREVLEGESYCKSKNMNWTIQMLLIKDLSTWNTKIILLYLRNWLCHMLTD